MLNLICIILVIIYLIQISSVRFTHTSSLCSVTSSSLLLIAGAETAIGGLVFLYLEAKSGFYPLLPSVIYAANLRARQNLHNHTLRRLTDISTGKGGENLSASYQHKITLVTYWVF